MKYIITFIARNIEVDASNDKHAVELAQKLYCREVPEHQVLQLGIIVSNYCDICKRTFDDFGNHDIDPCIIPF